MGPETGMLGVRQPDVEALLFDTFVALGASVALLGGPPTIPPSRKVMLECVENKVSIVRAVWGDMALRSRYQRVLLLRVVLSAVVMRSAVE